MRPAARILVTLVAASAAAVAGPAAAAEAFATSDTCGACHRDIYRSWSMSAHAEAMQDPAFLAEYRELAAASPDEAFACLRCHAPMAVVAADPTLERRVSWEGVACDFCHSITRVDNDGLAPRALVDVGRVKRGSVRDAVSTAHEVDYSSLYAKALLCAPCHQLASPSGVTVLGTFEEWRGSQAALRGETCQSCHMSVTEAAAVDPRSARMPADEINLHDMPGSRSSELLSRALRLSIFPYRKEESLRVDLELENVGAGHAVPTGMPGRPIVLSLEVRTSDGERFDRERVLARFLRDADGRVIERTADLFRPGVVEAADTRLAAGEVRREPFLLSVRAEATVYLTARLAYERPPDAPGGLPTRTVFLTERRLLRPPEAPDA